jgi:hypothetical protein
MRALLFISVCFCLTGQIIAQNTGLPKSGVLIKSNFDIHGVKVLRMELFYTMTASNVFKAGSLPSAEKLGFPMQNISLSYESEGKKSLAGCDPILYLKFVWRNPRDRKQYGGWIQFRITGSIRESGDRAQGTGHYASRDLSDTPYRTLVQTAPSFSASYWPEESARVLFRDGEVVDFVMIDNPQCGARVKKDYQEADERKAQEIAQKKAEEQQKKEAATEDAARIRQNIVSSLEQLPPEQRSYYQNQLTTGDEFTVPHVKLNYFTKIQDELNKKMAKVAADAPAQLAKRKERQTLIDDTQTTIDRIIDPAERSRLQNELTTNSRIQNATDNSSIQLLKRRAEEAIVKEEQEVARKKKEEEERLAEERRRQADWETRKAEQQRQATQTAAVQAAGTAAVTGFMISDLRSVGYGTNRWTINGGVSIGLMSQPLFAKQYDSKSNLTVIEEKVDPYGFYAHLEAYPFRGERWGIGLHGQYFLGVYAGGSGRNESLKAYQLSGRLMGGFKHAKLVGEYGFGKRSASLTDQTDLAGSSYSSSTYGGRIYGDGDVAYSRLGLGLLFEWGQFEKDGEDEPEEKSLTLMAHVEQPAFANNSVPVLSAQLRGFVDIRFEYAPQYPLLNEAGATQSANAPYWSLRLGKTVTIDWGQRRINENKVRNRQDNLVKQAKVQQKQETLAKQKLPAELPTSKDSPATTGLPKAESASSTALSTLRPPRRIGLKLLTAAIGVGAGAYAFSLNNQFTSKTNALSEVARTADPDNDGIITNRADFIKWNTAYNETKEAQGRNGLFKACIGIAAVAALAETYLLIHKPKRKLQRTSIKPASDTWGLAIRHSL